MLKFYDPSYGLKTCSVDGRTTLRILCMLTFWLPCTSSTARYDCEVLRRRCHQLSLSSSISDSLLTFFHSYIRCIADQNLRQWDLLQFASSTVVILRVPMRELCDKVCKTLPSSLLFSPFHIPVSSVCISLLTFFMLHRDEVSRQYWHHTVPHNSCPPIAHATTRIYPTIADYHLTKERTQYENPNNYQTQRIRSSNAVRIFVLSAFVDELIVCNTGV